MKLDADVLIVAREDDGLAIRLRHALEKRARRVSLLDGPSAAQIFTIQVTSKWTSVLPSVPMFFRPSAWWHDQNTVSADDRFLRAEGYSTFWAAAALSAAPVINRPGRNGSIGRMTWGAIVAAQNAESCERGSEIYASGPEMLGHSNDTLWCEDADFLVAPVAQMRQRTPIRARRVNPDALYEIVTVVGARAFSATTDARTEEFDLIRRSVAIAHRVNVHFATITWAIDESGSIPTRLNAVPDEWELRYAWGQVESALCDDLTP